MNLKRPLLMGSLVGEMELYLIPHSWEMIGEEKEG
jgi:hypothetical protein